MGRGSLHLGGGGGLLVPHHGGVDQVAALAALAGLLFQFGELLLQFLRFMVDVVDPGVELLHGGAVAVGLQLDAAAALAGAFQFGFGVLDLAAAVLVLVFQNGDAALAAGVFLGDFADLGVGLVRLDHQLLGLGAQLFGALVILFQVAADAVVIRLGGLIFPLLVPHRVLGTADGVHPQGDFQAFAGLGQGQKLLGLFAVPLEGTHPAFQFAQDVPQAFQVAFGGSQAALGLVFAVAVAGNARGFLKNFPAFPGFGGHDLGNAALAYDGVAVAAEAGVQKQLIHVLEADALAVDAVFTFAAAVVPAADDHLVGIHIQTVVGVIDGQADRSIAHGAAGLGSAEDDVLHFARAAQLLGAGLAHDPADGVGDIALARAVGPDNAGNTLADGQAGLVRKAFEALDLKFFQTHR